MEGLAASPFRAMLPSMSASEAKGIGAGSIIRRKADGGHERVTDEVVIEEPLEIRIGESPLAVTMRTPGNDEELAAGFLLSEAIVRARRDVQEIARCMLPASLGNVLNVTLAGAAKFTPAAVHRFGTISTSCGLCGKASIELIRQQFSPIASTNPVRIEASSLLELPERLRSAQANFARTGGIHAAAIFDLDGNLIVLREDIGRHNAVDKAIGRAFLDDLLPLGNHIMIVSGRSSLEIMQKALAAGIPIVAAVSAPSSLAINFARESNQTLIGFLRPPTFNIYAHIERVGMEVLW
jgi:FdhD protein